MDIPYLLLKSKSYETRKVPESRFIYYPLIIAQDAVNAIGVIRHCLVAAGAAAQMPRALEWLSPG